MTRLALLSVLGLATASALAQQDLLVKARSVVVAADTVLTGGELLVRQGRIAFVGSEIPADSRARARLLDHADATLVPGFVLAHGWLGQEADLAERANAFTPELRAAEAFDPFQDELQALARYGVTSCALAPSSRNVVGGIAALIKPGADCGTVATDDLFLKLSLVAAARDQERWPTSLMGAVELLRTAFTAARNPATANARDLLPLRQCLQRARRACIHADTYAELIAALELSKEFGIEPVLVGAAEADKCLPRIKAQNASVVLAPLAVDARQRQLELPGMLERAGIPFAFTSQQPELLRVSAALAVHNGCSRKAALAALTRTPAELLDQAAAIGSLRTGCAADFCVFSGDPLDLGSRLLAVYVGGVRCDRRSTGKTPAVLPPRHPTAPATVSSTVEEHR